MTHLGKHRTKGCGVVVGWEVEEVGDDEPGGWMWRADGVPARPIPVGMVADWEGETEYAPVRPPYWLSQHVEKCL